MIVGILIGLMLFGAVISASNTYDPRKSDQINMHRSYARIAGTFCFFIGLFSALGWFVEVLFF